MANLQATKSILAKLMATENISVSHQNVQTAYFDLKSRTIVLPVWKEMDGEMILLVMSDLLYDRLEYFFLVLILTLV